MPSKMLLFFNLSFFERRFGRPRRETTISSLRARRTLKNVVKCKCFTWLCACLTLLPDAQNCIFSWSNNRLVTSCSLDAQNCGRMMVFVLHRVSRGIARCFIYVCDEMQPHHNEMKSKQIKFNYIGSCKRDEGNEFMNRK